MRLGLRLGSALGWVRVMSRVPGEHGHHEVGVGLDRAVRSDAMASELGQHTLVRVRGRGRGRGRVRGRVMPWPVAV